MKDDSPNGIFNMEGFTFFSRSGFYILHRRCLLLLLLYYDFSHQLSHAPFRLRSPLSEKVHIILCTLYIYVCIIREHYYNKPLPRVPPENQKADEAQFFLTDLSKAPRRQRRLGENNIMYIHAVNNASVNTLLYTYVL